MGTPEKVSLEEQIGGHTLPEIAPEEATHKSGLPTNSRGDSSGLRCTCWELWN